MSKKKMDLIPDILDGGWEKAKIHFIVKIIEYIPHAVLSQTILRKNTGNITITSLAAGEEVEEKASPFDTFIQIVDGTADITIAEKKFKLTLGEGIIIPAHAAHRFHADEQFKMISTVIKTGYED